MIEAVVRGWREVEREMRVIDRQTDRATMWAVREAGRTAQRVARRAAPVYRGPTTGGRVQRKGAFGPAGNPNAPVAGLLRASIRAGKRLKKPAPGSYQVNVAPRGDRVHLYSGKIEAADHYMTAGYRAAMDRMPGIAARAWARSTRR